MSGRDVEHEQHEVFARLEAALPREAPPPGLGDRILAQVRSEASVVPLPRRARIPGWSFGAVAAAAAVVFVAVAMTLLDAGEVPTARATLEARTEAGVTGEAALYAADGEGGRLELILRRVPPSPAGHHYEVWILPEGSEEMISLGTFHTEATEDVELEFPLPLRGPFAAVDVSVEEDGGPEEHSDTSLATGTFT
ncbi:MAG: anti-sigma factor [Gaiellaceae bacterium]|nr:anti-sigma factor [Gaiellaceae bacterium]